MVFSLVRVFCIFSQGFTFKMHVCFAKKDVLQMFKLNIEFKVLKTLVLDPFAGENAITPVEFQLFYVLCIFTQGFSLKVYLFKQVL